MKLYKTPEIRAANSFVFSVSRKIFPTFFTVSVMFIEEPQISVFLSAHLMWSGRSDLILAFYSVVLVKLYVESNGLSLITYVIAYNHQDKLFLQRV
jgi:hypothetical protein